MNSNTALIRKGGANVSSSKRLPWVGLLALAMAGFICILTESLPAGLLPQIAQDLGVSSLRLAGPLPMLSDCTLGTSDLCKIVSITNKLNIVKER